MMKKNYRGVTLIELVIVITIVGALVGVSSMFIKETIDLWRFLSFRNEVVAQGRTALIRMEREIRQIQNNTSIVTAAAAQLQFVDINNNNITFQLSGNNLMRNSDILANNVTTLNFTYYNNNNVQLATPVADTALIYRIAITLTIQSGNQSKTLKSQVYPRNL